MRDSWYVAWRLARIIFKSQPNNPSALCHLDLLNYKAWITLKRREFNIEHVDTKTRYEQNKLSDLIISEIISEG